MIRMPFHKRPVLGDDLDAAGRELGQVMLRAARAVSDVAGNRHKPSPVAPSSLEDMNLEWWDCRHYGREFRVWDGASDHTIYGSAEANYAFRFVHDLMHVRNQAPLHYHGEVVVHNALARTLFICPFTDQERMTLLDRLYWADTLGQTVYEQLNEGRFPADQAAFCKSVVSAWMSGMSFNLAVRVQP